MEKFTKLKFKDEDFEMDINVSTVDNSIWLSQKELSMLFEKTIANINLHIKKIYDANLLDASTFKYYLIVQQENGKQVKRKTKFYNLDMILAIGLKIGSNRGQLLKAFLDDIRKPSLLSNNERIIIYNNGKIDIPINIDLKTENAWASVKQMAALYDTTNKNIYKHINNIISEGEMSCFDEDSVFNYQLTTDQDIKENIPFQKEILQLAEDGRYYLIKVYNLDVILAVGYRVKSLVAMRFRRWITFVLKKILTRGYYLDEERCQHCNKVLELENTVLKLKNEQLKEIRYFPGDELRGFIEIKRFLETAKDEIIIIDNYFGHEFDEVLLNINVKKTVITNPKNIKVQSNDNYEVIKVNYYHDRYIIVDKLCYTFGQSPKDVGIHQSSARRLANFNIEEIHQNIRKWKGDTYLDK